MRVSGKAPRLQGAVLAAIVGLGLPGGAGAQDLRPAGTVSRVEPQPTSEGSWSLVATTDGSWRLSLDPSLVDYERMNWGGLVEYGIRPPASMSPTPSTFPRPAYVIASGFLAQNAEVLGIWQGLSEYRFAGTQPLCDGSEEITFEQTHLGVVVDTTSIKLTVQDQLVRSVRARFVMDVNTLPNCLQPGAPTDQLRFVRQGTSSLIVVVTIEQLGSGRREKHWNYCTGELLDVVMHFAW